MIATIHPSNLRRTQAHEYAVRFLFGGLVTAGAGLIAHHFGPGIGGLFLAFPAIFPASATLIEKHEIRKKRKTGLDGTRRGSQAAAVDAVGAAIGSVGLIGFAGFSWLLLEDHNPWIVLFSTTAVWLSLSTIVWRIRIALKHRVWVGRPKWANSMWSRRHMDR
jgi:Protein of unknown function (DUF3147)